MKLTVAKSTKSETSGNYVTKLQAEKSEDLGILGVKVSKVTYYISVPNQVAIGTEVEIDLSKFRVEERPYELVDGDTGEVKIIPCKWLHLK